MVASTADCVQSATVETRKTVKIVGQVIEARAFRRANPADCRAIREKAHFEGLTVRRSLSDESLFYVSSVSKPGAWRRVSDLGCDCQGASRGLTCKHVIAVRYAQQKQGLLSYCPSCRTVRHLSKGVAERLGPAGGLRTATCAHCR